MPMPQEAALAKKAEILPAVEPKNLPEEKEIEAITGKYILTFSNIGGSIKDIKLKDYKALNSKEPLDLVRIVNPKEYLFNMSDSIGGQTFDLAGYELKKEDLAITYLLTTKITKLGRNIFYVTLLWYRLRILHKNISDNPKRSCL